jgi:membrane protease YdiL (CAAX protease family)
MPNQFDLRRTLIYLGIAYGIAIAVTVVIAMTGGLENSPPLFNIGGAPLSLALVLLSCVYMFAPTIGHVLTRVITREGWEGVFLRPHFRRGWRYWLIGWLHPPILAILGAALFFVIFPQYFDPNMTATVTAAKAALSGSTQTIPDAALPGLILTQTVIAILVGSLFNTIFTFGEEFGWRSYLLMRLMPLGWHKAMLLMGLIWGAWHWPILALGYNYGFDVPLAPWSGMLVFVLFTWATGTVMSWLSLRAGSVWPAVLGHGAINACAGIGMMFSQGEPSRLIGPLAIGLVGMLPWVIAALVLLLRPGPLGETPALAPEEG